MVLFQGHVVLNIEFIYIFCNYNNEAVVLTSIAVAGTPLLSGTGPVPSFNYHRACADVSSGECIAAALIHRCLDIQGWVRFEKPNGLENDTKVLGWHPMAHVSVCLCCLEP